MSIIAGTKLNKYYGTEPALIDVTFNINAGDKIGVVGANGAGKSTFIKILAKELPYDSGDIYYEKDIAIGYLKQRDHFPGGGTVLQEMEQIFGWQIQTEKELAVLSEKIALESEAGKDVSTLLSRYDALQAEFRDRKGYSYRSEVRGILSSLAFTEDYLDKPVDLLSGGERTRLALAALLLREPDVLLLDEPTNHLDIGTLKWLESYLKSYKGSIIVISHDRYFLDRIVSRIFEIERNKMSCYEGNYSQYKEKKQLIYQEKLRHYENELAERQRQEEIIRRFKEHNTEHLVKRAQSREKRLAQLDPLEKPEEFKEKIGIKFEERLKSGQDVLFAEDLAMSFGRGEDRKQLFEGVNLDIKKGDRICLVGPNGIGKTTLLKILLGELDADRGYIKLGQNVMPGYYDQEQKLLDYNKTVLDELHSAYIKYDQTQLRSLLGRFGFFGDDVFKYVRDLAGGEKAKLSLLKLMMSGSNLLVLDEPTNHLDITAKEAFEEALLDFPGTLLIVSHDRYLLQRIPTAIYELNKDGIKIFLGSYDYYSEKTSQTASGKAYLNEMGKANLNEGLSEAEKTRLLSKEERIAQRQKEKEEAAAKRKQEKELLKAEEEVNNTEARISELEELLCQPEVFSDPAKAAALSKELGETKQLLEEKYEIWMNLQ